MIITFGCMRACALLILRFKTSIFFKLVVCVTLLLAPKVGQPTCMVEVSQQRWPMPYLLVPQNSTVIINCALGSEAMPYFEVNIANASLSRAARFVMSQGEKELHDHGLFLIQNPSTSNSPIAVVEINNTNINNGTRIRCTYFQNQGSDLITTLLVYEPTAIELDIIDVDVYVVNISWSRGSVVTNLNATQNFILSVHFGSNSTVITTTEPHYSFTAPEGAPSCEVYNFSVAATYVGPGAATYAGATYAGAGCMIPSPVLSRMLPSLPDIEKLNSSLKYSLAVIAGEVKLYVTFESGQSCEDYPMLNYTLEIEGSLSKVITHRANLHQHSIEIGNLLENQGYSFRVLAANTFGIMSSTGRQFYTTDIHIVTATFDENNDVIIVQCDFIPGSSAQGCMVVLLQLDNTTKTVNLTKNGGCAVGMISTISSRTNYTQVIGYDIESNGSIGILAIHGNLFLINDHSIRADCMTSDMYKMPSAILLPWTIVTIVIVLIAVIIVILCVVLLLMKRSKIGIFRLSAPSVPDTPSCQHPPHSQPVKRGDEETKEKLEVIPLYDLPIKTSVADNKVEGIAEDTHHPTSKCDNLMVTIENITTYAEITDKRL